MINRTLFGLIGSLWLPLSALNAQGQNIQSMQNIEELQKSVSILSGIIEQSLEIEKPAGLFAMSMGTVDSKYLMDQGVVLEVRTPLSSQRNRLTLSDLGDSMRELSNRPFTAIQPPQVPAPPTLPLAVEDGGGTSIYEDFAQRWAEIDMSATVADAASKAAEAARSLRTLGELDQQSYDSLRDDINGIREQMREQLAQFYSLESQIDQAAADDAMAEKLEQLMAAVEPLKQRAQLTANQLSARYEEAKRERDAQWDEDVAAFENDLYSVLCEFGASLKALPEDERVSIVLLGLGDDIASNESSDKVHVMLKSDLTACQAGRIDAIELASRSINYSY